MFSVRTWVWLYSTGSIWIMTSSAQFNGSSLYFDLISLEEIVVPPSKKVVAFNVILVAPDPPIIQLKLEFVLL